MIVYWRIVEEDIVVYRDAVTVTELKQAICVIQIIGNKCYNSGWYWFHQLDDDDLRNH